MAKMVIPPERPEQSSVSKQIASTNAKSIAETLPLEIMHNLQHQHHWTAIELHRIQADASITKVPVMTAPASAFSQAHAGTKRTTTFVISGQPPRHMYIHPDLQNTLLKYKIGNDELAIQREWVVPMSVGETWSVARFAELFDALPGREAVVLPTQPEGREELASHQDAKRVTLGMLAHNGVGGDGTVVYYIMQEGEVKPRQNG